ncbi:MAG: hypothetical protein EOO07_18935 [Chitinophagaceae bacterium]|nr:MAG: hypothetical protein EOO07_18935 [Chitinophagaceae bacterium]
MSQSKQGHTEQTINGYQSQQRTIVKENYARNSDSSSQQQWLKIYPKGNFTISNSNFTGQADSLLWFGAMQKVDKKQHWQHQIEKENNQKSSVQTEVKKLSEKLNDVRKTTLTWWLLPIAIFVVFLLCRYFIRRYL